MIFVSSRLQFIEKEEGCIKNTAILIPAYNPPKALVSLCEELLKVENTKIVVVNDGSKKECEEIFSSLGKEVTVLKHDVNRGKGCALKTGLRYIYENLKECSVVVTADSDGQHTPCDIMKVASSVDKDKREIVLGKRLLDENVPMKSKVGNVVARTAFVVATSVKIFDTQTGLRAFPTRLIPEMLDINGDRFEYEINVLLWAPSNSTVVREIDIKTVYINHNSGTHFRPFHDSVKIIGCILKYCASSFFSFLLDYALALILVPVFAHLGEKEEIALLLALLIARVVSSFVNYFLNKRYVFRMNKTSERYLIKFFILTAFIFVLSYILNYVFNIIFGIPLSIAKPVSDTLLFVLGYYIQRMFIFKPSVEE